MRVVLLRVGIDTGSGGILGPIYPDHSFEFIPIPDDCGVDSRTYGNTMGRHGQWFCDYFPAGIRDRMRHRRMHVDPEFETYTYGDPTSPKAGLRHLMEGDLLVFYAGLTGYAWDEAPALCIVGYFEVEVAGRADDLGEEAVQRHFGANFHVMHSNIFDAQRDYLVLVKGSPASRLLEKAVRISEDGQDKSGRRIHVLSRQMREIFGDFGGLDAIQRSPPRWVEPSFVERAAAFVRSL